MTYDDYFNYGHYANSPQPYNADISLNAVLSQADINNFIANQNNGGFAIIKSLINVSAQVMSQFSLITSQQSVPQPILDTITNDVVDKIGVAILSNPTQPPSPINVMNYFTSNILDVNGNYILTVNNVATVISVHVSNTIDVNSSMVMATTTSIIFGGIRKFVDRLPLLNQQGANNLGNYIPTAVPDQVKFPGSDYIEIGLVEYHHKFHSDLKPTKVRGYVQLNNPDDPAVFDVHGNPTYIPAAHYGGPVIVANKNVPVRVKFTNLLPTGTGGDLFLPVDTSLMGAGTGNDQTHPNAYYTQNRATIHMHGGVTPWISDGTPHQWTTPKDEITPYPKGVSVSNVPDMDPPGPGSLTFYYTNQQTSRLMFYHDHSYGITRLNVYAGELSLYELHDEIEADLVNRGVIPGEVDTIPLIIQDKTFVPPTEQIDYQDPTWNRGKTLGFPWGNENDLWYPHVYLPNQNPNIISGANDSGRWDYGPWFWPPLTSLLYDPLVDSSDPNNLKYYPAIPNPSITPEAFMDTPVINGCVYPYVEVQQKAYRFKVLNACDDRTLNLQLHKAISNQIVHTLDNNGSVGELHLDSGDPHMVPACAGGNLPPTWPVDGRDGGVPDPNFLGPNIIQIGNEGGFIPYPMVHPNQPVAYEQNRRNIVVLDISYSNLLLAPAERADFVIDFSAYSPGDIIILYNDAPAANPAFDTRLDYFTGVMDQTDAGGAPTTLPGYGSNTRTIMQFRVTAGVGSPVPFDLNRLTTELGNAYYISQEPPLIPQAAYADIYGNKLGDMSLYVDNQVRIQDNYLTYKNINVSATGTAVLNAGQVSAINVTNSGSDYNPSTTEVRIDLPISGSQATATPVFGTGSLTSVNVTNGGSNYHIAAVTINGVTGNNNTPVTLTTTANINLTTGVISSIVVPAGNTTFNVAPTVVIAKPSDPFGIQATATAVLSANRRITGFNITNHGTGYLPVITVDNGYGEEAVLTAIMSYDKVVGVNVNNHGFGYWTVPTITFDAPSDPMGTTALGYAVVDRGQIAHINVTNSGSGYTTIPNITVTAVPDILPVTQVTVSNGQITSVTITNAGTNYTSNPVVTVSAPTTAGGTTAVIQAVRNTVSPRQILSLNIINPGSGYTSAPTITIARPSGSGVRATATAAVSPLGTISGVTIVNGGYGISSTPTINLIGQGTGATISYTYSLFNSVTGITMTNNGSGYTTVPKVNIIDTKGLFMTQYLEPKAIAEEFTLDYGRMNATFGVEIPLTSYTVQTTIMYGYVDPPTEVVKFNAHALGPIRNDGTQLWKITHNGVDTHSIHFHLVNVQLINRVGWDGMLAEPELNELGWKETIRMHPLQDTIVAMRAVAPGLPFGIPNSKRLYDVTMAEGATSTITFANVDPNGEPVTTVNTMTNYGWEYVWHCHILGHEENDMMRPVVIQIDNQAPDPLTIGSSQVINQVTLNWPNPQHIDYLSYNPKGIVKITVERGRNNVYTLLATLPSSATSFIDNRLTSSHPFNRNTTYTYRVTAINEAGSTVSNILTVTTL